MSNYYIIGVGIAIALVLAFFGVVLVLQVFNAENIKNMFRIKNKNRLILNRFYVTHMDYDYEEWEQDRIKVVQVMQIGKKKIRYRQWGTVTNYLDPSYRCENEELSDRDKSYFLEIYRLLPKSAIQKKMTAFSEQLHEVMDEE